MATDLIDQKDVQLTRRLCRMSVGQLAVAAEVSKQTIYNLEKGVRTPHEDTLWKVTQALRERLTANERTAAA